MDMNRDDLKIPKARRAVAMWVHPEGQVRGSIFLFAGRGEHGNTQDPLDVMNTPAPFIVLQRDGSEDVRFYNKRSIVRLEYSDPDRVQPSDSTTLHCHIQMMDGSLLDGMIHEVLPPWSARLYDYINSEGHRFLRVELAPGDVCLVNKAYVVHIEPTEIGDS
jgi:hypothetical protein